MVDGSVGARWRGEAGRVADRRQKEKSLFPSRFCSSSLLREPAVERGES